MKNTSNVDQTPLKMLPTTSSTIQNAPKNFSNLLLFQEKNQTKELFQAVMAFKNPKNLKQISEDPAKEQIIIEVIRICNKLLTEIMEEGVKNPSFSGNMQEIFDLVENLLNLLEVHDSKIISLEISFLNNYSSFYIMCKNIDKAKECLKNAEKMLSKNTKLSLWGLTYNNLASLAFMTQDYLFCYKCAEKTLYKLEPSLFRRIKENSRPERAQQIPEFMTELLFVLIGYLNIAISLEYVQKNPSLLSKSEKMTLKNPKLFYQNAHKLSLKYLSEDHSLTKKFHFLLNHGIEDAGLNIKPLSYNINFEDSEEIEGRNSFLNHMDSFDRTSELEDGFFNKKSKAFRVQTRKSFDVRAKSLNKVRPNEEEEESSFQADFSNMKLNKSHNIPKDFPYKKQMKEFEKTVKEVKKLKEKYERNESTFFMHKNLEYLLQQKELEDFISKRRDFQSSIVYPNTSGMFYIPQPQANSFNGLNKGPSPVDPNQLNVEFFIQKQKEMEVSLMTLQRENSKILHENDEKSKENQKLQDYVLKLEAERTSIELEKKIKTSDNSKEIRQGKYELNIAPASSFNNLNESNSDNSSIIKGKYSNRDERKFNLPLDNLKKEEKKTDSASEIKNVMKRSTPSNHIASSQIIPAKEINNEGALPIKKPANGGNMPTPLGGLKKSSSKKINERTSSQEKVKNPPPEKQNNLPEKPISSQEKMSVSQEKPKQEKPSIVEKKSEKQIVQEKPLALEKKSSGRQDSSFAPNKNTSTKRSDSIRRILIEFKGLNNRFNTTESIKKQDSYSSLDLALEVMNPSHFLKNILTLLVKNVVVRRKVFLDNKVFIFEFRIIVQENEGYLFKLLAIYESTGKPAIKEETLQITLIRKILQNIDYRDVIPFIYPLKTVTNLMKFSRYFILPFLGIGEESSNDRKVEIWPKAHGLIDKNIKILFLGDEFFMFFHFLVNDSFRLVLSNAKNGVTLRVEYQFDASSLKKFFEPLENPKSQCDEIQDIVHLVEILEDEDITEEMIKDAQGTISKYLQNKSENEIFIESFRVLDLNVFIPLLEKTIKEFEELLKSRGFTTLGPLISDDKTRIFKVKVWNEGNRYRFGILLENLEKKEFEIVLKNGFESHAPMKKMVKAMGTTSFGFEGIWKNFGLIYNKLDSSDKSMVASMVLDAYTLEIQEKALEKDDYDRYETNPIIPIHLECGGFFRTYIGTQYKFPLTLSMIGYQGIPIGVKVVIYDTHECKESGMFFTVNSDIWKKRGLSEQNKKKAHRYLNVIPIEGDFHLHYLLEKVGYKAIINSIQFEKGNNGGVETLGKCLIKGSVSLVDNLENLITMPTILEIYRNE